jgi:DNA polymerase IIIc chi subunit
MTARPEVIFIPIDDNRNKVVIVCTKVQELFLEGKRILIRVPTQEAAEFLDKKLWSTPPESFVPHHVVSSKTDVVVAITSEAINVNDADTLVNLTSTIPEDVSCYKTIVELDDSTTPEKAQQTEAKIRGYR